MTRYIPKDKLKEIRSLSAIDYLKNYHPDLLIRNGRTDYIHVDHDSLHFSNGKWYWWSKRKGGTSAIDYLVTVEGYTFMDACETIIDAMKIAMPVITHERPKKAKPFVLPPKDETNDDVIHYLCDERMIDKEIVNYFVAKGQIYQSKYYKNAVFVGFAGNKPAYAFKRSINSPMKQDHAGSNKAFSFSFTTIQSDELHIFEGAIDMLSYITLHPEGWQSHSYVACCGTSIQPVLKMLERVPQFDTVLLCLDNDDAGHLASKRMSAQLTEHYTVERLIPENKDWNDDLTAENEMKDEVTVSCQSFG